MARPRQSTHQIMMIRPAAFGFNPETAVNNSYQQRPDQEDADAIRQKAVSEFDQFVATLRAEGVEVNVIQDDPAPEKPDAVFPNNWISFHEGNILITYPMFSPKRRQERREEVIEGLEKQYQVERRYSFEFSEEDGQFLEGTGSMVLDRVNQVVYACLSQRTNIKVLDRFCLLLGYRKVVFHAVDEAGEPIYHTNVMMALGTKFAVVCLDAIPDPDERKAVEKAIAQSGRELIPITYAQKNAFAGNMLEVVDKLGQPIVVMSETAYGSLDADQRERIGAHGRIIHPAIPTIERYGGGSVRCMMAELFLEKNEEEE